MAREVALGMQYLHARNIIHGDLVRPAAGQGRGRWCCGKGCFGHAAWRPRSLWRRLARGPSVLRGPPPCAPLARAHFGFSEWRVGSRWQAMHQGPAMLSSCPPCAPARMHAPPAAHPTLPLACAATAVILIVTIAFAAKRMLFYYIKLHTFCRSPAPPPPRRTPPTSCSSATTRACWATWPKSQTLGSASTCRWAGGMGLAGGGGGRGQASSAHGGSCRLAAGLTGNGAAGRVQPGHWACALPAHVCSRSRWAPS